MSARSDLRAIIEPLLPEGWRLIPYQDSIDQPDSPVVVFKQLRIDQAKELQGAWLVTFVLTIIDGRIDPQAAEDGLDDEVETLWEALATSSLVHPTTAEKVLFQDTFLAYDITTEMLRQKES